MSCHGTPGNRAVTSLACALTSTPADEVSRRFHALKRQAPEDAPAPAAADVQQWWHRQAMSVRGDEGLSAWRKARLAERVEAATTDPHGPDAATWFAWRNLRAACDDAHTHRWLATAAGVALPLSEQEPGDIDGRLADIWERVHDVVQRRDRLRDHLLRAGRPTARHAPDEAYLERVRNDIAAFEEQIDAAVDETEPYEAEYRRRGGWARHFRVITSGQGHVHSSRNCHSCYPTTTYLWLPALSGKGEDEAVDDYGSEMCSHCFPGALSHPSYLTRGRIAEETRARREAEQAQRQAIRDAKGITAPDGSELRLGAGRDAYPERIGSAVTAERELISRLADLRVSLSDDGIDQDVADFAARRSAGMRPADEYREYRKARQAAHREDVEALLAALAHKRGESPQEVLGSVEERVAKRARLASRAWQKTMDARADYGPY